MPFQPVNYASIPAQGNPFLRNFVRNLAQGFQAGQMPAQMERRRIQEEMVNALNKLKLEQEPQRFQSEMEGHRLSNALRNLQLQQEPERFKSLLSSQGLANQLRNLQLQKAEMEIDPNKKIAYLKELTQALNGNETNMGNSLNSSLIRKELGLPALTPEEKKAQELDLYREKQKIRSTGNVPTGAFTTSNQTVIQAVDNTLPLIKELKEFHAPGQLVSKYIHPDIQAQYEAKVATITDSLVNALKLPKTNESINLVQKIVGKRPMESNKSYFGRLNSLESDLMKRRDNALSILKNKKVSSEDSSEMTFNPSTGRLE